MTAPASVRIHTDAAVAAIEALAALRASPLLIGRGEPPAGAGWQEEPGSGTYIPFVVVYPSPGTPDGSLALPVEYLDYRIQATCVSASQEGTEAIADLVTAAWVNTSIPVSGRFCYPGQMVVSNPVIRDDAESPPVHYAVIQVQWRTQAV